MHFHYRSFPNQVYFGKEQVRQLPQLVKVFPKIFVIAGNRLLPIVEQLQKELGKTSVIHFSKIIQHVPLDLVEEAQKVVQQEKPNAYLAMGGGSAIGLAKALALEHELPIIALPTTFAGSEQTNIYGISSAQGKKTGRADQVLPKLVIYDPDLTISMPKPLAVTSAMNAMAHLMEALYAPKGNPITSLSAIEGMKSLKIGLEELADAEQLSTTANESIQFGAYLAGKCLCEVPMALHHKAAHVLGGTFGMEHSQVHTALQSYVLAYQWPYLTESIQKQFKEALSSTNPPLTLQSLAGNAGGPTDLKSIGFQAKDIEQAAVQMAANPYANVAPLTVEGLTELLKNAYLGQL